MNTNISILGCGWLGKALAKSLISDNYSIKGSTTKNENFPVLESLNITPFKIDIESNSPDVSHFLDTDVLIIAITSKHTSAFKHLIESIEKSNLKKVIFVSSTSVYENTNSIVTEETLTKGTPLAKIEQLFINTNTFQTTILRFGGLYGYDRQPGHFFKSAKPISNPKGYINFIHQDDCINIIKNIIQQEAFGYVFNACTDSHPTRKEFYSHEFKKVGRAAPIFDDSSINQFKIISSEVMKSKLNYEFIYADLMK